MTSLSIYTYIWLDWFEMPDYDYVKHVGADMDKLKIYYEKAYHLYKDNPTFLSYAAFIRHYIDLI
jgi:hypothetical protein